LGLRRLRREASPNAAHQFADPSARVALEVPLALPEEKHPSQYSEGVSDAVYREPLAKVSLDEGEKIGFSNLPKITRSEERCQVVFDHAP
jgi:hypothetical protein